MTMSPGGMARRAFLAASAGTAAAIGFEGTAFAQVTPGQPEPQRSTVAVEAIEGGVLLVGIDRTEKRNLIDPATFIALGRAYHRLDHDDSLRVAVLYGRGPNFTPGIDAPAWGAMLSAGPFNPNTPDFINPLSTIPPLRAKPVVAAVHGLTKFVGHELFLAADLRVAATDTVFSQGEASNALFAAGGGTIRFVREAGWGNAMRYMLTGDEWGAEEVLPSGPHPGRDAARQGTRSRGRIRKKDRILGASRRTRDFSLRLTERSPKAKLRPTQRCCRNSLNSSGPKTSKNAFGLWGKTVRPFIAAVRRAWRQAEPKQVLRDNRYFTVPKIEGRVPEGTKRYHKQSPRRRRRAAAASRGNRVS